MSVRALFRIPSNIRLSQTRNTRPLLSRSSSTAVEQDSFQNMSNAKIVMLHLVTVGAGFCAGSALILWDKPRSRRD